MIGIDHDLQGLERDGCFSIHQNRAIERRPLEVANGLSGELPVGAVVPGFLHAQIECLRIGECLLGLFILGNRVSILIALLLRRGELENRLCKGCETLFERFEAPALAFSLICLGLLRLFVRRLLSLRIFAGIRVALEGLPSSRPRPRPR